MLLIITNNVILMGNKERILELLQDHEFTIKEIAEKLNLNENKTRVYINRLKKEDKIVSISVKDKYKVYTVKKQIDSDFFIILRELIYDLTQLYNLIKYKMEFKKGLENPADQVFVDSIQSRLDQMNKLFQDKKTQFEKE
jgi:transcriptional regulator with XRE-family HTH domain